MKLHIEGICLLEGEELQENGKGNSLPGLQELQNIHHNPLTFY